MSRGAARFTNLLTGTAPLRILVPPRKRRAGVQQHGIHLQMSEAAFGAPTHLTDATAAGLVADSMAPETMPNRRSRRSPHPSSRPAIWVLAPPLGSSSALAAKGSPLRRNTSRPRLIATTRMTGTASSPRCVHRLPSTRTSARLQSTRTRLQSAADKGRSPGPWFHRPTCRTFDRSGRATIRSRQPPAQRPPLFARTDCCT